MNIEPPFVAVDWGTSKMRAMLCSSDSLKWASVQMITGEGIGKLERSVPETLFDAIDPWIKDFGKLDILLGGMVGSNIGWRMTPYVPCPLKLSDIVSNLDTFEDRGHRVAIVPGVSCINRLGQPDVMRGEEVQIIGWLQRRMATSDDEQLLCLPGTHTKWVQMTNGRMASFTTSVTGEAYSVFRDHSVLVATANSGNRPPTDSESFAAGVSVAIEHGDDLLQLLFSTRSRALLQNDICVDASSYLSGLLVGADVRSALRNVRGSDVVVELIGELNLCEKFATAIGQFGFRSNITDGDEAGFEGFRSIAKGGIE